MKRLVLLVVLLMGAQSFADQVWTIQNLHGSGTISEHVMVTFQLRDKWHGFQGKGTMETFDRNGKLLTTQDIFVQKNGPVDPQSKALSFYIQTLTRFGNVDQTYEVYQKIGSSEIVLDRGYVGLWTGSMTDVSVKSVLPPCGDNF